MKAISTFFAMLFSALIGLGMLVLLYFYGVTNLFNIQTTILSSEVDRHTINLGQATMSSDYLVYFDNFDYYRGIFSEQNLDAEFLSDQNSFSSFSPIDNPTNFDKSEGFPNSIAIITVQDLETGKIWRTYLGNSTQLNPTDFATCLGSLLGNSVSDASQKNLLTNIFVKNDVSSCFPSTVGEIGSSIRTFQTTVKTAEGVDTALLYVNLVEY